MSNQLIQELPGLLAWYPHTFGSGSTIYDYSGNSNDLTITGSEWRKIPNGSYTMDNVASNNILTPTTSILNGLSSFTLIWWVYLDSQAATLYFLFRTTGQGQFYRTSTDTVIMDLNGLSGGRFSVITSTSIPENEWVMLTFTYNSSLATADRGKVYFNTTRQANINPQTGNGTMPSSVESYNGAVGFSVSPLGSLKFLLASDQELSPELIAQIYRKTYIS